MTYSLGQENQSGTLDILQDGQLFGEFELNEHKFEYRVRRVEVTDDGGRKRFLPTKWQTSPVLSQTNVDKVLRGLFAELPFTKDYGHKDTQ